MSLWTLFKLIAAAAVLSVMAFTGMLAYHVAVAPLGGIFEEIIPNPAEVIGKQADADFAKMLDSAELPDIDPGEKAFQKAHELLALGKLEEAREKLTAIVNIFPTSSSAPVARRIVGEINLDEVLSTTHMEGKQTHVVKRGNSYFGIAAQYKTTLDSMMHLNNMMELANLQPGDEIVVLPLEFRLLIEPRRKSLSIWDGGRFIREYPILRIKVPGTLSPGETKIASKLAVLGGRNIAPQSKEYRAAEKSLLLGKPAVMIRAWDGDEEQIPNGICVQPHDMEEISLLTRAGNTVEIR
jgi:LysM repeat protein